VCRLYSNPAAPCFQDHFRQGNPFSDPAHFFAFSPRHPSSSDLVYEPQGFVPPPPPLPGLHPWASPSVSRPPCFFDNGPPKFQPSPTSWFSQLFFFFFSVLRDFLPHFLMANIVLKHQEETPESFFPPPRGCYWYVPFLRQLGLHSTLLQSVTVLAMPPDCQFAVAGVPPVPHHSCTGALPFPYWQKLPHDRSPAIRLLLSISLRPRPKLCPPFPLCASNCQQCFFPPSQLSLPIRAAFSFVRSPPLAPGHQPPPLIHNASLCRLQYSAPSQPYMQFSLAPPPPPFLSPIFFGSASGRFYLTPRGAPPFLA